jgi:hypothetical protein
MRMLRARHVLASSLLLAPLAVAACMDAPSPKEPVQPAAMSQGYTYQQQAGYAGPYPQQAAPPGMYPAPTASAPPPPYAAGVIPGLVEAPPATVPDAVGQLDRAEQLLGFVLPTTRSVAPQGEHPAAPSASVTPGSPVPLGDPCLIACAALASMKRSADHVCTMAGEKEPVCDNARARVQRAEQRVLAACPACAAK